MRIFNFLLLSFEWISKRHRWTLIISAIIIKLSFFFTFSYLMNPELFLQGIFWKLQGDANDYIEPIENLISQGSYITNDGLHAVRTPGFAPLLLFFRLFLPFSLAINSLLITQVLLSGLSCFYLAKISKTLFNSHAFAGATFLIFVLSTYVSIWNNYLLTESLASSFLIISIYHFNKAVLKRRKSLFLLSGFLLTWSIFLRPFLLPFILFIPFVLLQKKTRFLQSVLIFLIPFILIETSWAVRNYNYNGELTLLQSRKAYNDKGDVNKDLKLENFIGSFVSSFGGDHTTWNPKGASNWFFNEKNKKDHFPEVIFHKELDYEKLKEIKAKCISLKQKDLSEQKAKEIENEVKEEIAEFYYQYKNDHPAYFYVVSRIKHFLRFNFHSGVYNLPFPASNEQNLFQKLVKGFYAILYLTITTLGILGIVIGLLKWKESSLRLVVIAIPLYLMLLFPIVYRVHEFRFNTLAYPFLLLLSLYIIKEVKLKNVLVKLFSSGQSS